MRPTPWRSLFAVLLASAFSGGCTVQYVGSSNADPALQEARTGVALEVALRMVRTEVGGREVDVQLAGSHQRFDFYTDAATTQFAARARYFPADIGPVRPWVGGGLGIVRLGAVENAINCRNNCVCLVPGDLDRRSGALSLSPHVSAGAEIGLGETPLFLVGSASKVFATVAEDWSLNSWRFGIGLKYDPK